MTHTYKINGMHCANCVDKISKQLSQVAGIEHSDVSLVPPQAVIKMSHHINTGELNAAVKKAGDYSLEDIGAHEMMAVVNDQADNTEDKITLSTYKPLIIIFAYLIGFAALTQIHNGRFDLMLFMNHFMGGFFLIFSFFKMLNISAFADAYSSYDVIAKKWRGYGYVYPFIELGLGISFFFGLFPMVTNVITIIVMGISSIGVIQSVLKKNRIQCACLGTVFNLPMTTITIIEDLLMVLMATVMLILL